jgi:hypothetical protein
MRPARTSPHKLKAPSTQPTRPADTPKSHLQVFDQVAREAARRKRRVDALCRKVVELLEVGVHDNLFFIGVLEGLDARQRAAGAGDDGGAAGEAGLFWGGGVVAWGSGR